MSDTEQNKTEEATPFKLKRAREKGQVARGTDLAFFSILTGLSIYFVFLGPALGQRLLQLVRTTLREGVENATTPQYVLTAIERIYMPAVVMILLLAATVIAIVIFMEIIQLRGLIFSTHPLKPDFNRINPGKGLKRIFSMRTLKEALKNIFKMTVYAGATYILISYLVNILGRNMQDAHNLTGAMYSGALRLLFMYIIFAIVFAAIDQIIVRNEFKKQMRMSRSELDREHKDREGEPRMKQKRKKLHEEFAKQTQGLGQLPGSDVVLINPVHYAVALSYDPREMKAPKVSAKGRNKFAEVIKSRAFQLSIPVISNPSLTRALFKTTDTGHEISADLYHRVADIYIQVRKSAKMTGRSHAE